MRHGGAPLPPHQRPHDLQARPSDLARLARARVLVRNGLGLDDFLLPLIAGAGQPDLKVIDASRGVTPLPQARTMSHDHGHDHDHDHDHGHDHGGDPGEGTAAVNPHVWLDPLRARQQVDAIREGLIAADPSCRRATAAGPKPSRPNSPPSTAPWSGPSPPTGQDVVTYHDLLPYFAARYGLKPAVLTNLPGESPSIAALEQAGRIARREGLRGLLAEPQQQNRALQPLSRDLDCRSCASIRWSGGRRPPSPPTPATCAHHGGQRGRRGGGAGRHPGESLG